MLDSIYHMTLRLLLYDIKITLKSHFCRKNVINLSLCTHVAVDVITFSRKSVVYRFYCMRLFHSQTPSHMIKVVILKPEYTFFKKKYIPTIIETEMD